MLARRRRTKELLTLALVVVLALVAVAWWSSHSVRPVDLPAGPALFADGAIEIDLPAGGRDHTAIDSRNTATGLLDRLFGEPERQLDPRYRRVVLADGRMLTSNTSATSKLRGILEGEAATAWMLDRETPSLGTPATLFRVTSRVDADGNESGYWNLVVFEGGDTHEIMSHYAEAAGVTEQAAKALLETARFHAGQPPSGPATVPSPSRPGER